MTIELMTIVGARPQFVKAGALSRAVAAYNAGGHSETVENRIVHTGQHYDHGMSQVFFDELGIPPPCVNLAVGSGSHGAQTGAMLTCLETVIAEARPDWVVVLGDTNSTLAGALASAQLHVPVGHVEAGLRSWNRRMPEEINRVVADVLADLLFCPTEAAVANLEREGITRGVHKVGDVMYDSVLHHASEARGRSDALSRLGVGNRDFYLGTIHRAENTDDPQRLAGILEGLGRMRWPTIVPLHPRTRKSLATAALPSAKLVRMVDPLPYMDMLRLEQSCRLVLTDSGGVQKEAYWFGVPCVTLRDETEWVELVAAGCNRLAGASPDAIVSAVEAFEAVGAVLPQDRPKDLYGDGHSADRIIAHLVDAGKKMHA
jgi:UDP-N-acetylglucosamine 2-epimerase